MVKNVQDTIQPKRRRDLDAMGGLVVLGLIFFHSARIFDTGDFYVKNEPTSDLVTAVLAFAVTWAMPLMFLMAGMAVWYSLRKRTAGQFAMERIRRLLIPLVFGILVLIPPQVYIRLSGDPAYSESYWDFLASFFDVEIRLTEFPFIVVATPERGLFEPGQLWFLICLFAFSLVLLPVFLYLRRPAGNRALTRGADFLARPWAIFLLATPLMLIQVLLGGEVRLAAWNRYSYLLFILYGFVIAADRRFGHAFQRNWKSATILGLLTFLSGLTLYIIASESAGADPFEDNNLTSLSFRFVYSLSGWLWIVAILGLAGRLTHPLRRREPAGAPSAPAGDTFDGASSQVFEPSSQPSLMDRIMRYASEAQLPIYVLHQTIIVAIGFFVVTWGLDWPLKYLVIALATLVATLGLYDVLVRRTQLTRFLFGMKPLRKERAAVPAARAG
jgi:hypothetical protein